MQPFIKSWLYGLMVIAILSGCSSLPDELQSQAGVVPITDYRQWVNTAPSSQVDIRLAGVIDKVTNLATKTRLEIVNLPISDYSGKPDITQEPQGRFIAYIDGFVEPRSYRRGRLITVIGKNQAAETGKVGQYNYIFPVMQSYGQHLWDIQKTTVIENNFPMGTCWRSNLRCGRYGYGPYGAPMRATEIKEVR